MLIIISLLYFCEFQHLSKQFPDKIRFAIFILTSPTEPQAGFVSVTHDTIFAEPDLRFIKNCDGSMQQLECM